MQSGMMTNQTERDMEPPESTAGPTKAQGSPIPWPATWRMWEPSSAPAASCLQEPPRRQSLG